jgi:nicotinate-nucleotide adenylyltransferase
MRLGVLGGTFNPVHCGHLRLAEEAVSQFSLEKVLLVLSAIPPHKANQDIAETLTRWKFLTLACRGNSTLVPCDLEMTRTGPSYTVDTLTQIRGDLSPEDQIFLILGLDAAVEIQTWKSWRTILEKVNVVVAHRMGSDLTLLSPEVVERIQIFEIPQIDISSSRIRKMLKEGQSIRYLVPENVREAILSEGVYSRECLHRPILDPSMKHLEAVP